MKKIPAITKVAAKILEVSHWVGAALMAGAAICLSAAPQLIKNFVNLGAEGNDYLELNVYGFEITAPCQNGMVDGKTFVLFCIVGIILLSLMAMVFRNLYLILKRSENSTPFQKDNVRMLREIGIFSISVPVVGIIMSGIVFLVLGPEAVEISVNSMDGLFIGFVMLCLTQIFSYGIEIEKDVDGLL